MSGAQRINRQVLGWMLLITAVAMCISGACGLQHVAPAPEQEWGSELGNEFLMAPQAHVRRGKFEASPPAMGPVGLVASKNARGFISGFKELQGRLPRPESVEGDIRWVHVPKCGTSFFQTLLRFSCPRLPEKTNNQMLMTWLNPDRNATEICPLYCPGGQGKQCWDDLPKHEIGKGCVADAWQGRGCLRQFTSCTDVPKHYFHRAWNPSQGGCDAEMPAAFMFIRDPKSRVISAHYHDHPDANMTDYVGCQTRMLIGKACYAKYTPTQEDVQKAIKVLREDMRFVGITDDWSSSILLFHAMFGTTPALAEFGNMRNGKYDLQEFMKADEELANWHDPYDGPVFAAAQELVKERMKERFGAACSGVTNSVCDAVAQWFKD